MIKRLRTKLGGWIAGEDINGLYEHSHYESMAYSDAYIDKESFQHALNNIEIATRNGKSGTARKINRMAQEALGMDDKPVKGGA